jgi:hypothetical protein
MLYLLCKPNSYLFSGFCASSTVKERINSRITSVAGRPVIEQYFSNLSASPDVRLIVSRLTAHFLFTGLISFV